MSLNNIISRLRDKHLAFAMDNSEEQQIVENNGKFRKEMR